MLYIYFIPSLLFLLVQMPILRKSASTGGMLAPMLPRSSRVISKPARPKQRYSSMPSSLQRTGRQSTMISAFNYGTNFIHLNFKLCPLLYIQ